MNSVERRLSIQQQSDERNAETQAAIREATELLVQGDTINALRLILTIHGGNPTTCHMLDAWWVDYGKFYPKPSGRRQE